MTSICPLYPETTFSFACSPHKRRRGEFTGHKADCGDALDTAGTRSTYSITFIFAAVLKRWRHAFNAESAVYCTIALRRPTT